MLSTYHELDLDKDGLLSVATYGSYQVIVNREQLKRDSAEKFAIIHDDNNSIADIHNTKQKAVFHAQKLAKSISSSSQTQN